MCIRDRVQSKIRGYQWNLIEENAITYEIREIKTDGQIHKSEINPPEWKIIPLPQNESEALFRNKRFTVDYTILDHKTDSIAYLFKEYDTVKINMSGTKFKGGSWVRALKTAFENNKENQLIKIEENEFEAKDLFHLMETKRGEKIGVIMDHAANEENHQKIKTLFNNCDKVFIESFYKAEDKEFAKTHYHSYSSASAKIMKACKVKFAIPVHFSRKYKEAEIKILMDEFNAGLK